MLVNARRIKNQPYTQYKSQWINRARQAEDKQLDQEKDRHTSKEEDGGNSDGLQPVSALAALAANGDGNTNH